MKIRPVCRTTGCKVYITRKYGLKYLAFKYRKHYSFAIGIITAFLIVKGINNYVWDISFQGNSIYSDQYIYNYLCSLGLEIKPVGKNGEETLEQTEFKEMLVEWYFSGNWVTKWEEVD